MIQKKIAILAFATASLLYASCGNSSNDTAKLLGKWQMNSMDNPAQDSMVKVAFNELDTMTVIPEEIASFLEGISLDSFKALQKNQMNEFINAEKENLKNIGFEFQKDSVWIVSNGPTSDTGKWFILNSNTLITVPSDLGQSDTLGIETSTDKLLVLTLPYEGQIVKYNLSKVLPTQDADIEETVK